MNFVLLSRITKDFLNLDPEIVSSPHLYRTKWAGSTLASIATPKKGKKEELLFFKKTLSSLFPPTLNIEPPQNLQEKSLAPPYYFFKGEKEKKRRPIEYLLTQTSEITQSRAIPMNTSFLRSLSRGKGILKQSSSGLIYLEIDGFFISAMLPFLERKGLLAPPYIESFQKGHIPVISQRESSFHYLDQVEGLGKSFSFELEGLYSTKPESWPEMEEVWFFKVKSEELELFRRKNLLSSLPGGHSFHIAVAIKPRITKHIPSTPSLMKVNISFLVA